MITSLEKEGDRNAAALKQQARALKKEEETSKRLRDERHEERREGKALLKKAQEIEQSVGQRIKAATTKLESDRDEKVKEIREEALRERLLRESDKAIIASLQEEISGLKLESTNMKNYVRKVAPLCQVKSELLQENEKVSGNAVDVSAGSAQRSSSSGRINGQRITRREPEKGEKGSSDESSDDSSR